MGGPHPSVAKVAKSVDESKSHSTFRATIGVLALQGAFANHISALRHLGEEFSLNVIPVRTENELSNCDALIIPGGESTTMNTLLSSDGSSLLTALRQFVHEKKRPVWGTCAGCIILADRLLKSNFGGAADESMQCKSVETGKAEEEASKGLVAGIDVVVSRNYFGRQSNSFEAPLSAKGRLQSYVKGDFPAICIRAPGIVGVGKHPSVEILATIPSPVDGGKEVVAAAAQDRLLVSIFHPELTGQDLFHRFFLEVFVLPSISCD